MRKGRDGSHDLVKSPVRKFSYSLKIIIRHSTSMGVQMIHNRNQNIDFVVLLIALLYCYID